jgi:predicted deacetylase
MAARYLVRFDDICSTMNWPMWQRVEKLLLKFAVRPLLAVVPENLDPNLNVHPPRGDFWEQVRTWQARGWTIGWHGYQHRYSTASGGIIGIHVGSEFADEKESVQREKLHAARRIFDEQRVVPEAWIAPGHSFDAVTVRLLPEFGIRVISDGYSWRPARRAECVWVPQQLWRFHDLAFGTWTVCYHFNTWSEGAFRQFERDLEQYASRLTNLEEVLKGTVPVAKFADRLFESTYRELVRLKLRVKRGAVPH